VRSAGLRGRRPATDTATPRATTRLDGYADFIVGMIEERKDITLNEMVERLDTERSMRIGRSALSDWLGGHGWTFKKSPHTHWSGTAPTS